MPLRLIVATILAFSWVIIPTHASAEERTPIGVILPLSGPVAEYGIAFQNGIEMAKSDRPELADTLDWRFEDSKYESSVAVSAFHKLRTVDRVKLMYVFGGPMSDALAPLADANKLPLFVSIPEPRTAIGRKFVIRFANPADDYGVPLVRWMKQHSFKRIALVKTENQYLNCMADGLARTLSPEFESTVLGTFTPDEKDFRTIVSKMRGQQFDVLGLYLLPGQLSSFYRLMQQHKIATPSFGTDFLESTSEIRQAGGAMEGVVFPNNTVSRDFSERYVARFKNDSQITWGGYGYEWAMLVGTLLPKKTSPQDPNDLLAAIRATATSEGVMGRRVFVATPEGDAYFSFPVVLKKVTAESVEEFSIR